MHHARATHYPSPRVEVGHRGGEIQLFRTVSVYEHVHVCVHVRFEEIGGGKNWVLVPNFWSQLGLRCVCVCTCTSACVACPCICAYIVLYGTYMNVYVCIHVHVVCMACI